MHERIGPYRIVRKIGEGGMGVVYAAHDERLGRTVAIKTMREAVEDATLRERFVREARAAASVAHPNVCQLFDIGDEDGRPFLVMELLEGESLAARLSRGPLSTGESVQITLSLLMALHAFHERGFVHRDLKPSNVFLTPHGLKILDFGLAREVRPATFAPDGTTMQVEGGLTVPGMILGTPRYMSPEQLLGRSADQRSDLFAVGAMLYEMVSGTSAFSGSTPMTLFHAIVYEPVPNLGGSATIAAINRIIHRAMAKEPADRYQGANAMAADLRQVLAISDVASCVVARPVTRLIVLPFRVLRSDPDTDFLAQALPEALTMTLAGIGSLIMRSPLAAAKLGDAPDLTRVATELDVDVALTGTLLRGGDRIRVTTQLVEVPAGTILWSSSAQATFADLFELQDSLTHRIVTSLELPLTERESKNLRRDVPATALAHEYYLRAGQQPENPDGWSVARDLYLRALDEDPRYAPSWARLARVYVMRTKYARGVENEFELAEAAIGRALDLNPDLPIVHRVAVQIDVVRGRAREAMLRLLDQVHKGTNDPDVFAGLVMACRYCGLLEESAAAHEHALQLDPKASTSAAYTYWMLGDHERALAATDPDRDVGGFAALVLLELGRREEARAVMDRCLANAKDSSIRRMIQWLRDGVVAGNPDADSPPLEWFLNFPDCEGIFAQACHFASVGRHDWVLPMIEKAEAGGFFCYPAFLNMGGLDPLRTDPRFVAVLHRAESRSREAAEAFARHPGGRILTVGRKQ